jgi:lysine 2,3-aminomutase
VSAKIHTLATRAESMGRLQTNVRTNAVGHNWDWERRNSLHGALAVADFVATKVGPAAAEEVIVASKVSSMQLRLTPHLLSLIEWDNFYGDPIRRQFIPVSSELEPDAKGISIDSLAEMAMQPTEGLVHRYPQRVLLLMNDVCPIYCTFCTRSYAVGPAPSGQVKQAISSRMGRIQAGIAYIASDETIEDVILSGGDPYLVKPELLDEVLTQLVTVPHLRRIRIGTRGLLADPHRIQTDSALREVLARFARSCSESGKESAFHCHFNHAQELTDVTAEALLWLSSLGLMVRNQSVILRGVNDDADTFIRLLRKLTQLRVRPYYAYQHDMVPGVNHLRTTLAETMALEASVRGQIGGPDMPHFVVDLPGGGGKRDVYSFEYYIDGVAMYRNPWLSPGREYFYLDPLRGAL